MKVYLLAYTMVNPQLKFNRDLNTFLGRIAKISVGEIHNLNDLNISDKKAKKIQDKIIQRKHDSVLEFLHFVFLILGISRVTSHQLVRHRMASYLQMSQRYTKMTADAYILPEELKQQDIVTHLIQNSFETYQKLIESRVKKEVARYVLPNATTTNIIMAMNLRSLINFWGLRLCSHAQTEIRELAFKIYVLVYQIIPDVVKYYGPRCIYLKHCPEGGPFPQCGQIFKKLISINPFAKEMLRDVEVA